MQVPSFPTDNLYKFMALSGLAILGFSTYIGFRTTFERSEKWREHYFEYRALELKLADIGGTTEPGTDALDPSRRGEDFRLRNPEFFREWDEHALEHLDLKSLDETYSQILNSCRGFGILGVALALFGFWQWYQKLQRPLDQLLRAELEATTEKAAHLGAPSLKEVKGQSGEEAG